MLTECAASGLSIDCVFLAESYCGDENFACERRVRVSDDVFKFLCDEKTPQGVLGRVYIPTTKLQPPTGRCLLLDGVSDPGNMGAILRTANAAGYGEVYLTKDCTDPYAPKSVRASMSGVFFTKIYVGEREEILSVLDGVPIVTADMGGENIFHFRAPEKYALAIGNEGNGISDLVKKTSSFVVRIPMRETQESLNAAVSAGIFMYFRVKDEWKNSF